MKRIVALVFVLAMLLSLAACGIPVPRIDSSNKTENTVETEVEQPDSSAEETTEEDSKVEAEVDFTEVVAVDNEECIIKITGIDAENMWGYTLKALLENKSADKTYMFSVDDASINGVQCDPFFASEVAAGKKSNAEISFSEDELEKNGITEYTDIELTFRVYESDNWEADDVAKETIHIYPYGEDKAEKFVREEQPSDNVIVDNDNVTVIVTGYEIDEIWGYTVNLFLLNKTDKNVMFSVDDASVNGFMADPFYAASVSAGKCAFSSMSWSDTEFEENGITDVETIEFTLRAYDEDDWFGDDLVNESVTLNP